ncbi:MAG: hypothetical protein VYE22_21770 [Myxococcota bacterium]|nr:hypothetical protein [Myxococcota bacterium]
MARADEGLRSDELQQALALALKGQPGRLDVLLARHGGLPGPNPNTKLGAAFGEALAAEDPKKALRLALRLAEHDADAEGSDAFLPVAGGFALCALARRSDREPRGLDEALFALAADERTAVRIGLTQALTAMAAREGGGDALVRRAEGWLFAESRDERYAAAATALDAIADPHALAEVRDRPAVFAYLDGVVKEIVEAPRSAERAPSRRRMLAALRDAVVRAVPAYAEGPEWLEAKCAEATHEDLRAILDDALGRLRRAKIGRGELGAMHDALASSAKPPRDPTRTNEEARGRGRKRRRRK